MLGFRAPMPEQQDAPKPASEDPAPNFIDLAKASIARGAFQQALEVCETGVASHPRSVVGRVLWGKALIQLGRPAEAMEQFDQAVAVDKDSPKAYNLIAEVLLRKGLYRSAVPLLRKAVALQPDEERVRTWLEQTQRALTGGDPPELPEVSPLDSATDDEAPPAAEAEPAPPPSPEPPSEPGAVDPRAPTRPAMPRVSTADGRKETPPMLTPTVDGAGASPQPVAGEPGSEAAAASPDAAHVTEPAIPESGAGEPPGTDPKGTAELASADKPTEPGLIPDFEAPDAGPKAPAPPPLRASREHPLLDGLPELPVAASDLEIPKVELSPKAAEAIAEEYERELREKLEEKEEQKRRGFWGRHGWQVGVALVVVVGSAVGATMYFHTRAVNQGRDLASALAYAKKALVLDTFRGTDDAIDALKRALAMDSGSVDARALSGYAYALRWSRRGRSEDRTAARDAFSKHPGAARKFPGLAEVSRALLASSRDRARAEAAVLKDHRSGPLVDALAGALLLEKGKDTEALRRIRSALSAQASLAAVRARVSAGRYYGKLGDDAQALTFYGSALQISAKQPEAVLGEAASRLALGEDLSAALAEVRGLKADQLTSAWKASRALLEGRLLTALGKPKQALATLEKARAIFPKRAFDLELALGEAHRASGDMAGAQRAIEAAWKIHPRSENARVALGHVLLDRGREAELLKRLPAKSSDREVHLLRGAAWAQLQKWNRARAELAKTQVDGKYSARAVVYLALADAAQGDPSRVEKVLRKAEGQVKGKSRGALAVALGEVLWKKGDLAAAKKQFEQAMAVPGNYEGGCALGRLLLQSGHPDAAVKPLTQSIARNGSHAESREALVRADLALGKPTDALAQLRAWSQDDPSDDTPSKLLAEAQLRGGDLKAASANSKDAVRHLRRDPEAFRIRAQVLFAEGSSRGAMSALERSNHLDPKSADTFCAIAHAFSRQGRASDAKKAYQAAQKSEPSSVCAEVGLAAASAGRSARRRLRHLAAQAPDVRLRAEAAAALSLSELRRGATRAARKQADVAVQLAPNLAESQWAEGAVLARSGDLDGARKAFAQAVQLDPTDERIHLAFAQAMARSKDTLALAISEYRAFLRYGRKAPEWKRVRHLLPRLQRKLAAR